MAVIVDVPGVGPVEARNAATESTLRELVNAMKGMGGGGRSAGGGAGAGGTASLGKAANDTAGSLKKGLSKAAGAATSTVSAVASAAKTGAEALAGLTAASAKLISQFANVGNDLGRAADTLAPIPIIGPALSATLGAVASAATATTGAFKQAASSGATFGGSVNAMARSASQAGMTISDFAALVSANGEALLGFGNTTEGGAKTFARLSKDLRSTGSDLYALGFGTKEINEGLANYGKLMRAQGRSGTQSNAQLVSGAQKYLKEMDLLAKVTGRNRKELEDQRAALAIDGQLRAAMAGLGPDVEDSVMTMVQSMPTPELQAFAKDLIANGTATTDANRALMAQMPGLSAQFTQMHKTTQSNNAISKEQMNQTISNMGAEAEVALKRGKYAFAANEELQGTAAQLGALQKVQKDAMAQGIADQNKATLATDGQVKTVEQAQEALAAFSNSFQMALANSGLLDLLMDSFSFLANIVQKFVIPAFNILTPILAKVFYGIEALLMPVINSLSGSMGGLEGTIGFIDQVLDATFAILDAAIRGTITVLGGLFNGVSRVLEPFKVIYDRITNASGGISTFTDIIAEAASLVGGYFEFMGEIVASVIEGFIYLYDVTKDFLMQFDFVNNALATGGQMIKTAFETLRLYLSADGAKLLMAQIKDLVVNSVGGFFANLLEYFEDFFITLQNALPNVLGGISDEEAEERRKAIAERKEERAKEAAMAKQQIDNLRGAAMVTQGIKQGEVEAAKDANKAASAEFNKRDLNVRRLGGINDKEADVRKDALKGKEEATKNLNDPIQMLMAEAKQQKSGLVKTPEGQSVSKPGEVKTPPTPAASAAAGAKASVEADAEKKAQEAQKAKEAAKEAAKPTTAPTETPTTPGPGQTSGQTAIAQLNTSIEELVRLMRINNSLTSEQSSGLSRLAGSVTGDLFQV